MTAPDAPDPGHHRSGCLTAIMVMCGIVLLLPGVCALITILVTAPGVLVRIVIPETPVRVEYRLTEKGRALAPVVEAISNWSHEWMAPPERCVLSFTDFDIYAIGDASVARFVGGRNYAQTIADQEFWYALRKTLYPSLLSFGAAALATAFGRPDLASNGLYMGTVILVVFWLATSTVTSSRTASAPSFLRYQTTA